MERTLRARGGRCLLVAPILATLAFAAPAQAEPAGDPYLFAREPVDDPDIASVQPGSALATWGTDAEPAFRALTASSATGSRLQASTGGRSYGSGRVVANPRLGEYLHVWRSYDNPDGGYRVTFYSQRRDAAGRPLAEPVVVRQLPFAVGIVLHDIAWNQRARRYVVAWAVTDDSPNALNAMLLDEGGRPLTDESMPVEGSAVSASVAVRPGDGGYLVTWSDVRFDFDANAAPRTIRGQLLDVAGRRRGAPFRISEHVNLVGLVENDEPSIAVDPDTGDGIVVWTDQYEVFGRRIDAAGAPVGTDLWLSRMGPPSDPAWLTRSPAIAYNPAARQYLVVWQSGPARDAYPAGEVVYGQHLDRGGRQIGANDFPIATADRAVEPSVTAMAGTPDFLVAWSSHLNGRTGWARRVTPTTQGPPAAPPENNPTPDRPPVTLPVPSTPTIPGIPGAVGGASGPPLVPPNAGAPVPAATLPATPAPPTTGPIRPGAPVVADGGPARALAVRVVRALRLRAFARSGLRVTVTCATRCRSTARLLISRRDARRLRVGRQLARKVMRVAGNRSGTAAVRPSREVARKLLRLARLDVTVSVESIDAGGVVRRIERRVRLRR